jgi:alkanesulfonate monooxygenase SsuD/methylene tetrahydromethanopterin reductase-like flavin-dependent oxidoreductase (luciferase family)
VSLALGINSVSILGGRPAHLALGASTRTVVRDWHGREWGGNVELAERTIARLRNLLAGERSPEGFRLASPLEGTRIGLAGFGPRMAALAGRVADRLLLNLVTPAQVAPYRAGTEIEITVWVPAALGPDPAAIEQLQRSLRAYLVAPAYAAMFADAGLSGESEILRGVSALGDLDAIRARVAEYHAAGADTVILFPATAGDPGAARLLNLLGGDS